MTIVPKALPEADGDADKKVVYTVTYAESNATYTVKHFLKNLEGEGYTEIEGTAQPLNGVVGSSPVPDPLSTETYPYIEYEKYAPATVAEDGSTVIEVYYTRKNVTLTYDSQGGSYIAPIFAPYGSTVNVYSIVPGGLGCGLEEHTHTAKPTYEGSISWGGGTVDGCWTWRRSWETYRYSWQLSCGETEHTHDDSCYENAYNPAPTRTGYTFAGWYTDPQCNTPASAQTELNGDQTVYAKWEAGQADYTIVYMKQVYDNATGQKYHVYHSSEVGTGTVGQTVTARDGVNIDRQEFNDDTSTSAVIKADSSTVVYAYYDLIEYTIIFDLKPWGTRAQNPTITMNGQTYQDDEYRLTVVLGQDISASWPTPDKVTTSNGYQLDTWNGNYKTIRFEVTDDMLPDNGGTSITYDADYTKTTNEKIVRYWLQTTDGSGYEVSDNYSQVFIQPSNDGLTAKSIYGFTQTERPSRDYPDEEETTSLTFKGEYYGNIKVYNFYYNRSQYNITYHYGSTNLGNSKTVFFGADINNDTYNWTPTPELVNLPDDYTFVGWYDNAECLGDPYNFSTMPANNLALYAKFTPPARTVTLVYYDGYAGTEPQAIEVTYGETVESLPTPTRPGYTFLGWFTNSAATEPFDINQPITENMTIYAGWQRKALEYKVQYLEEGTNEPLLPAQTIRNDAYTEGQEVRASAPTISGYRVDAMTKSINLNIDPSQNVITFRYAQRKNQEYSVHYYVQGTETSVAASKPAVATAEVERVVEMAATPTVPGYEDYYPIEKVKTATVTTSLREIIFYYAPYGTVTYTINYVDKDGEDISGVDPQTITKKIGDSIQPENYKKDITGYTFDRVEDDKEYLVAEESGTVKVNLYYTQTFTVTYDEGDHGSLAGDDNDDGQIIHANIVEGSATPDAPAVTPNEGYYFTGWNPDRAETVTGNATYTAQYAEKHEITVVANSDTVKYDGTEHEVSGFETLTFVVDGNTYKVEGLTAGATGTDAGEYTAEVTGTAIVKDEDGNDVTAQFTVTTQDGKLTIEKRNVTLTSATDSKKYDGDPLTNDEVTVGGDGFATDEGATYTVTGSQTVVGSSANSFTYELNAGTKADNYNITKTEGTLTVTDREEAYEITVVAKSDTAKYDGEEKSVSGFVTTTFEVEGNTYTVEGLTASATGTDADEYTAEVTGTAIVKDEDGNDVTAQFTVTTQDGKLTIEKRNVTLTSATDSKKYDGDPLTNDEVTVGGDGFATDEGATYTVTGSQTVVGSSANSFTYELNAGTKADNYNITKTEGTLTVTDREEAYEITVVAKSDTAKYDGEEKSVSGFVTTTFEVEGNTYTVEGLTASATGTDADEYTAEVTGTAIVKDEDGNDVTAQFTVTTQDGKLTIEKRNVTLTSATDSKKYDGDPLTNDEVTVGGDGFATDEGATYTVTGSQTVVGSSANSFTYELNAGTKADNYNITKTEGTLTVTDREEAYEITVVAKSDTAKYDGEEKSVSGFVTTTFEVEGNTYTVEGLTASATGTDADEYTAEVTGTAIVKDEDGNDVTAQFTVTTQDGKLTIEKRNVTLTSATDSKKYDGDPLTNDEVTVGGDGFATDEGATYTVTGSQTVVGSSANSFTYELNAGTKADNYNITKTEGTLTVTDREEAYEITVVAKSDTAKYDGEEKSVSGFVTTTFEVEGNTYTVEGLTAGATGTDADEYTAEVTGTAIVKDEDGNDVTAQFTVTTQDGKLTIEKRNVTLTSATDSKKYDGDPLTNDEVTVGGDGFATDEGATYTVTGSQTVVGSSANSFTYELNAGTKADNYNITKTEGTLTVTDREEAYEITVVAKSDTAKYDGEEKSVSGFVTTTFKVEGNTYTVEGLTASATGTDAGEYPAEVTGDAVVKDANDNDVTAQFAVKTQDGTLTITPRSVTLTSATAQKEYDGTALTNDEVTVSGDGFVEGEGAAYEVTGSQLIAGNSDNVFTYELNEGTKAENYKIDVVYGKLTVTDREAKYEITVVANSGTAKYDGEAKSVSGFETLEFVVNGQTYTVEGLSAVANGTEAGEYTAQVTGTAIVKDAAGNDVTKQFTVSTKDGTLTITPRSVTLTSATAQKEYDGTALTNDEVTVSGDGFAKGEGATYEVTGSQLIAGNSDNVFTYELNEGTKAENYKIDVVYGKLTVTDREAKYEITVVANSGTAKYDGEAKSVSGFEMLEFVVNGQTYKVEGLSAEATGTDAGDYTAAVTGTAVVKDAAGNDVTKQFTVNTQAGKLTVQPREITLTSASDEKEYDGTALTNDEVTVSGDGFADGEGFAYDVTGSQTLVGSSENIFTYAALEGTKLANYMIATVFGTLTVVDESVDPNNVVTKTHEDKEYDLNEIVTFTIRVTNIYDEVKTITLREIEGVTLAQSVFEDVQPGDTIVATATYQITESDILNGSFVNTVTATFSDGGTFENTDEVTPEEPNGHLTINKVTTSTPANGTGYALGETITYEITVVNDGNLTITDITVTDDLTGDEWTILSLEPGAEQTFTAEYVVTEADILAGSVKNVATATGTSPDPDDPDPGVDPGEEEDETEEPNGHLTINKVTTSTPANGTGYALGETITYEITVVNDGNLTLTGITVTDDLTGDEWTIPSLEPGAEQTFTAEYVVTEADILAGSVKNVATATGTSPDPDEPDPGVDPGEEEDETEDKNGHLTINKVTTSTPENGTGYALGETITYEITVVNDGNLTITDITVTDDLTGDEWTILSLEPGAEQTFTAEYVVTEADILAGSVKNVATATGTSPDPDDPDPDVDPGEEEDPTEGPNGHLTINKETTSTPANGTGYALGETITYEITVVNDGNLTIADITVTDDLTGDEWTIPSLEPGAEQTFTAEYVVTEADILAGSVKNVATATGTSPDPDEPDPGVDPGEEEDETEDKNGHLTINKVTTSTPENGTGYALGETITYEITVVNDGNLTIADITVTDDLTGDEWTIPSLEPGAEETFTAEYVVTEADILAGSVKNVATATGTSPDPDDPDPGVDPGEEEDETEDKNGHLTINKVTTSTPENGTGYALGETITYEITVVNDGNLTLTGITVTDDLTGDEWTILSLEPGAEQTFTAEYVVTEADILAGSVKNVATATGTSPDPDDPDPGVDPGEEEDETEDKNGHLTINKVTTSTPENGTGYALGETITYEITVVNDGNLTITDITVTDDLTGDEWTILSLEPGAEQTFTAEYVVTEADILAGSVKNVATATGTSPDPDEPDPGVDPGEEEDETEDKNGHLTINKVTTSTPENGTGYALGETITYEITVVNDGNLTITDITVTDDLTGDEWTILSLEPGAEQTFTAEYVVTEADILAGSVKNVATATGTSPDPDEPDPGVDPGEEEDETEDKNGHLTINKVTTSTPENGTGYALGETITYEITVVNDGNLTITDITVTDDLTGDEWTILSLEPGAEQTFTAEYVVTEADILAGSVKNVATATGTSPDPDEPDPGVDPGEEEDETEDKNGHLTINKVTTSTPENGTGYALGETITYEITVVNDGNLTITDITVTDDLTGDEWTILSLEPGAEQTFTAEYVVTEADILAGSVKNVATATGTSPDPDEPDPGVDPGEEEDETEDKNGHLTINKVTTSTPENGTGYALGETITYEITVVNDGNLTITDITVTDDLTGDEWTIPSLEPGAEQTFTAEYVVTEADILAGSVKNVATATGTNPDDPDDPDDPDEPDEPEVDPGEEDTPTEDKNGHLTIEKETTGADANNDGVYEEGETIRYLIRVINDGNLTITDITVTDELTGDTWTIESLEPGAEQTFTTSHVVSSADGAAGVVVNVATATGTSPDPEQPDVPVTPGTEEVPTEEEAIRTDLSARINYVYIGNSALNHTERLYDLTQGEVITDIGSRVLRNTIDGYTVSRVEGLPMTVRVTESRNVITVYYEPQILTEILDLEVPTGASLGGLNVGDCCE